MPFELDDARLPRAVTAHCADDDAGAEATLPTAGGSVVPLPTRARQIAAESPEQSVAVVAEATRDLQRIAGEADATSSARSVWRAPAPQMPRLPIARRRRRNIGELVALRMAPPPTPPSRRSPKASRRKSRTTPENRFFEALAEIRALKRAANQAGE